MFDYGHMGYMGFFPGMGLFFWVIFAIVIFLVVSSFKNNKEVSKNDDALEILRSRFAKGEITKEEYLSIKETLKR